VWFSARLFVVKQITKITPFRSRKNKRVILVGRLWSERSYKKEILVCERNPIGGGKSDFARFTKCVVDQAGRGREGQEMCLVPWLLSVHFPNCARLGRATFQKARCTRGGG